MTTSSELIPTHYSKGQNQFFNPCDTDENERIPAKIWELLRRNERFRKEVTRLLKYDARTREIRQNRGKHLNPAWEKSCRLLERVRKRNEFAAIALEWLVPEPLIHIVQKTFDKCGDLTEELTTTIRPENLRDPKKSWDWRDRSKRGTRGALMARGPEIYHFQSNRQRFRDDKRFIEEWREWKAGTPLFTVDSPWPETAAGFRSAISQRWRLFDSRPSNSISMDRSDSPKPMEVFFFQGWNLQDLEPSTVEGLARVFEFMELSRDYRVFAIPKWVITKGGANAMGKWLQNHLKTGNNLLGKLLEEGLLDGKELLGSRKDWNEWVGENRETSDTGARTTYSYRHEEYLRNLSFLTFPEFDLVGLLRLSMQSARGKASASSTCGAK